MLKRLAMVVLSLIFAIASLVAGSPSYFFSAGDDGWIGKWNTTSATLLSSVQVTNHVIYDLAIGNGGLTLFAVTNSVSPMIRAYNALTMSATRTYSVSGTSWISKCAVANDDLYATTEGAID
jgi:WD40 repeat protein